MCKYNVVDQSPLKYPVLIPTSKSSHLSKIKVGNMCACILAAIKNYQVETSKVRKSLLARACKNGSLISEMCWIANIKVLYIK